MNGFKNAPEITEFAIGMRIRLPEHMRHGGKWATVRWVEPKGMAHCETEDYDAVFPQPVQIPDCILDLDSVWVGREYMGMPKVGDNKAIVRMVNADYVLYSERHLLMSETRDDFLENYMPLPLASASHWKPGDKITLRGKIRAGQDHGFHEFDFGDGKEFEVAGYLPHAQQMKLMAEGYGKPGAYGNGCLFVSVDQIEKPKCEGCSNPADGQDINGVPLCQSCGEGAERMDDEPIGPPEPVRISRGP